MSAQEMARCQARRQLVLPTVAARRETCATVLPRSVVERRKGWLVGMHVDRGPTTMAGPKTSQRGPGLRGGTRVAAVAVPSPVCVMSLVAGV